MSVLAEQEGATRTRSIAIVIELITAVAIVSSGAVRPKAQDMGRDQLPPDVIEITGDGSITAEELARQQALDQKIADDKEWEQFRQDTWDASEGGDYPDFLPQDEGDDDTEKPGKPPLNMPFGEGPEQEPPEQNEDVIPIAGDSSGTVDEIMVADLALLPRLRPATYVQLRRPVVSFFTRADGTPEMRVFSSHRLPEASRRRLMRLHAVVVPASRSAARRANGILAPIATPGSGIHVLHIPLGGYCVDYARRPPTPGGLLALGGRATQARYAPMRSVRVTSDFAAREGFLRAQGDRAEYGRFVTQYAIWTKLEHWNEPRFTQAFVDRTRQAWVASHKRWTGETERTVRSLAPARWRDVAIVINAAARIERRQQSKGTSHVQR